MEKQKFEFDPLCVLMEEKHGCTDYALSERCIEIARDTKELLPTTRELCLYAFALYQAFQWSNKIDRDNQKVALFNSRRNANSEISLY